MSNATNPEHYKRGRYECWDVMEEVFGPEELMIFCKLNAFKYLYRCDKKNGDEDLDKAETYLRKFKEVKNRLKNGGRHD